MDLELARSVLKAEADAILSLNRTLDDGFRAAVEMIQQCRGRVVVSGMGKAGLIGRKISATFASTGTPSLFLHPAEALHGDLGQVIRDDVALLLTYSGETEELIRLVPNLRKIGARILSITARADSALGKLSDNVLAMGDIREACPLGLAPSASTAAMHALGDALALTIQKAKGFDVEDFAFYHPGGELGRKLLKTGEIMRRDDKSPTAPETAKVREVIDIITRARAGAIVIVDAAGRLAGIFTDGDLRRVLLKGPGALDRAVGEVMTRKPVTIAPDRLATEALRILREKKIDELPVVDGDGKPVGMLDVQDLLAVGLV